MIIMKIVVGQYGYLVNIFSVKSEQFNPSSRNTLNTYRYK